ncbi:metal ABC transporter solute-binding protein, Zn/Mn family [Marinisporobacter balticus]|uniref:Zinc transport system substrate-binding protein n=1 Tax=Marinisporobacter balticus TaxID=2018667 RepID=A0A4R2KXJ1_9FIRM|nr:zinc ABC transporter substrate-binding protein [Marinisporobacter balticus]TCO74958.1 zinc transport system substrate-binding protein [Marinisporobacter balticus]
MQNRLRKIALIGLSFILFFVFVGCSEETVNIDEKLKVAVSIVPEETFVKAVGGDLVEVVTMIPPGNSPANYAPSPREMQMLSKALLYFSIGVPTEKSNIIHKLADINRDIQLVALEEEVGKVYKACEFSKGNRDPHIWLSPKRVKVMIETIQNKLAQVDPKNKAIYEENAKNYIEKLDKLDKDIKSSIKDLPYKSFLVYHPSFGYFAEDYGLKMVSIEKEGKEANIEDIKTIIAYAKKEKIKVVFYQAEIDSKQSNVIAEEIGGKTKAIAPLAPNYIENLENMAKTFADVLN